MREALIVALGGAVGSVVRWLVGQALGGPARALPWGTLTVNVAGSLALGVVLAVWPAERTSAARLLLGVGFCGGFTTFSTFSAELVAMLERGETVRAGGYAVASLTAGAMAVLAGLALGRAAVGR
jgi:CrcB protein